MKKLKTLSLLLVTALVMSMCITNLNVYADEVTENDKLLSKLGYDLRKTFKNADNDTLFEVAMGFIVDSGELKTYNDYLTKNPNTSYKQYREIVNKYNDDLALSYGIDKDSIIGHTRIPGEICVCITKAKLQSLLEMPSLYYVFNYKNLSNMNPENYIEDGFEFCCGAYLDLSTGKYYTYDSNSETHLEWLGADNYYSSTAIQNITYKGKEYVVNHNEMTVCDKDGNKDEFLTDCLISAWRAVAFCVGFCEYRKIVIKEKDNSLYFYIYCFDDLIRFGIFGDSDKDSEQADNDITFHMPDVTPYSKIYPFGDVNLSMEVDMEDVTTIQKYIANLPCKVNTFIADFNYDNRLTMLDVVALQRKIAKL